MIKLGMQDVAKRGDINELMNFDWCFINSNFWIVTSPNYDWHCLNMGWWPPYDSQVFWYSFKLTNSSESSRCRRSTGSLRQGVTYLYHSCHSWDSDDFRWILQGFFQFFFGSSSQMSGENCQGDHGFGMFWESQNIISDLRWMVTIWPSKSKKCHGDDVRQISCTSTLRNSSVEEIMACHGADLDLPV